MFKMKRTKILLGIFLGLLISSQLYSWGFFGHKAINRMAVFTLPKGMIGFYKSNITYITEQSVAPDKRRHSDKEEAPKHYLDADHYGKSPFDSIPMHWKDAVAKYSEDTLKAYGTVPWRIEERFRQLTNAFKERDSAKIVFYSADLGHYVADACVPLHTTENYDGQLSGQKGIHGFWESRLPELFSNEYDFFVGKATYINDPLKESFTILRESFAAMDSVLLIEKQLNNEFASDKKYSTEQKGSKSVRSYSYEYSKEYHKRLNGMVERRMRRATIAVGSYWYSAWVNAGQPDLKKLINKKQSEAEKKDADEQEKKYKEGKIIGRPEAE
jgi:hypothetical protein